MTKSFTPIILLTLVLTACGGGGGGNGTSPATATTLFKVATTTQEMNKVDTLASGDLNNDGLEDVVVGGWANDGTHTAYIGVYYQNANGTLTEKTLEVLPSRTYQGSQKIFIADFDNDGRNDIILPGFDDGNPQPAANTVIFWNNSGQFIRQDLNDQVHAHGACYSDIDRDGDIDMIVSGGGVYINQGGRNFTVRNNILSNNFFDSCSIVHNTNNTFSVLLGNNNQVAGYKSSVSTFDYNYNLLGNAAVVAPVRNGYEFDLINSIAVDINNDGAQDLVAVFNDSAPGVPGVKQALVNDGTGTFTAQAPFDTQYNNAYYAKTFFTNGHTTIFFGATNGDVKLYQIVNGAFALFKQTVLDSMASMLNTTQGNWNTGIGIVYQNTTNGKNYMLQYIGTNYYTHEL